MTRTRSAGRRAGVLLPLFSMPSSRSWGIGEITDIPLMARWLRDAGISVLQLLPTIMLFRCFMLCSDTPAGDRGHI